MQNIPMISVLMPVYNGERWLDTAIKSILMQTFRDFELLVLLEYGSSPKSREIVYSYTDKRIRVIENQERLGLAASLNRGIREARGKYIARMDSDDVSGKKRFERQVAYMERHPKIAICGTAMRLNGTVIMSQPASPAAIRFSSFQECVFYHPTVMWRRKLFLEKNLFYGEGLQAEDYELWMRVLDQCKGANLREPLLLYRQLADSKSHKGREALQKENDWLLEPYWSRNGLRYYAPESFGSALDGERRQKEWRLLELAYKTENFKGKKEMVRKLFFDANMADTLKIRDLIEQYHRLFSDLYPETGWERMKTAGYAVFRVTKRKIRLKWMKV